MAIHIFLIFHSLDSFGVIFGQVCIYFCVFFGQKRTLVLVCPMGLNVAVVVFIFVQCSAIFLMAGTAQQDLEDKGKSKLGKLSLNYIQ